MPYTVKKTKLNVWKYDGEHFNETQTYKTLKVSAVMCNACIPRKKKKKTFQIRDEIKRFIRLIIRLTKITSKDLFKIHTQHL